MRLTSLGVAPFLSVSQTLDTWTPLVFWDSPSKLPSVHRGGRFNNSFIITLCHGRCPTAKGEGSSSQRQRAAPQHPPGVYSLDSTRSREQQAQFELPGSRG